MDALVKEALAKVNECLSRIVWEETRKDIHTDMNDWRIAKAINAVDALKSALKSL